MTAEIEVTAVISAPDATVTGLMMQPASNVVVIPPDVRTIVIPADDTYGMPWFSPIAPSDVDVIAFNFSLWAQQNGDTVNTATVTATPTLTISGVTVANNVVSAWMAGATAGECYVLSCDVVTAAGRNITRYASIATANPAAAI